MKKFLSIFTLCIFIVSCKPSMNSDETSLNPNEVSLNGEWNFLASNTVSEAKVLKSEFKNWDKIYVPGNWDTENAYANHVGNGYYQKEVNIPKSWESKQIRLRFDAVYETAKVWLNGELLGEHKGGYTPFEFNITDKVFRDKPNTIIVQANNSYKRGAWWAWGGISRNVTLLANADVRVVWQHISAQPNFKTKKIAFDIKYKLESNVSESKSVQLEANIYDSKNNKILTKNKEVTISANSTTEAVISFEKDVSTFDLWHFDSPILYQLNTQLNYQNNKQLVVDKFGIRKVETIGEQLFLNNEAVRLNGFNRVHDHPAYGNTEPYELVKHDITEMKSLGANFSRMMHAPAAPSLLKFCDSIGYMLVTEIPVWGSDDPNAFTHNPLTKKWLKEMIDRDYNHASVIGYSVGNELGAYVLKKNTKPLTGSETAVKKWTNKTMTPKQYGYANSMLDYIDELDTTRLKTFASYTSYLPNSKIGNEVYEKVDFLSINTYGDAVKKVQTTHKKFPGKPIFFTEIGKGQLGESNDAVFSDALLEDLKGIQKLPYVFGSAVWTYNDYRSNYKGTPASGNRAWGVVDVWRNKKPKAFAQVQKIFGPVHDLTAKIVNDKVNVILTPRKKEELPSYTLNKYNLKYNFYTKELESNSQKAIELSVIEPGAKELKFTFQQPKETPFYKISLISPLGIEMTSVSNIPSGELNKIQDLSDRIIHLQKIRNQIVIGYNVSKEETSFTFKYGNSKTNLTENFASDLKGFVKIPWNTKEAFYIKMKSETSEWSKVKNIQE